MRKNMIFIHHDQVYDRQNMSTPMKENIFQISNLVKSMKSNNMWFFLLSSDACKSCNCGEQLLAPQTPDFAPNPNFRLFTMKIS